MQFEHFRISTGAEPPDVEHLNRFLGSHHIVSVDKRFVDAGENSFWSLLVTYMREDATKATPAVEKRIDQSQFQNDEPLDASPMVSVCEVHHVSRTR